MKAAVCSLRLWGGWRLDTTFGGLCSLLWVAGLPFLGGHEAVSN